MAESEESQPLRYSENVEDLDTAEVTVFVGSERTRHEKEAAVEMGDGEANSGGEEGEEEEEEEGVNESTLIESKIPARLDRLPWCRWHTLIVVALGVTWILDGLEITSIGILGSVLKDPETLGLSTLEVGMIGSIYISGAVTGSIVFGIIADRLGRKKLYMVIPSIYTCALFFSSFCFNFLSIAFCVFMVGFGIGGEYSSMNSAIQEFIPARIRGSISLVINGSYWLGSAAGAALSLAVLNHSLFPVNVGWRLIFILGFLIGIVIIALRSLLPESPRWCLVHNRVEEAERITRRFEKAASRGNKELSEPEDVIIIDTSYEVTLKDILKTLLVDYPKRSILGLVLICSQSFFYNAIFFTYSLILNTYYGVSEEHIGFFLIPFALGNFLGPLALGWLFDVAGRKLMITSTYLASGCLLLINGVLFTQGYFNALTQTLSWSFIFFISSAAASSAYLTVSEIFPMEMRSLAIAIFYSLGTGGGGIIGPLLFGYLIDPQYGGGDKIHVFLGYMIGAGLMICAAYCEAIFGIAAEGMSLEKISKAKSEAKASYDAPDTDNIEINAVVVEEGIV